MEFLDAIYNTIMEVLKLLFVHDVSNPFYTISVFIVVSIIVISTLFMVLKYHD